MLRFSSLADRVTWAVTGTVAVFLLAMSLLAYETFSQMEDDLVESVVAEQVEAIRADLSAGRALTAWQADRVAEGGRIQVWVRPADAAAPLQGMFASAPGGQEVRRSGRTWHTWVEAVPQGLLYVRYDATTHEDRVRAFGWILACGAALALLCAWLLARRLAGRVVAPIRLLTARLAGWGIGGPEGSSGAGDEAARLIEAFNHLQDRVGRSMAFERQFAANLSHELRTPLAALRSDCEMAQLDVGADSPLQSRLRRMLAQIDAAASSLSGAVALNSQDPSRRRTVVLRAALEEAWSALKPMAQSHGLVLQDQIPDSAQRLLDPDALQIVMRNLLRNAIEHAAPATLSVSLDPAGGLVFRDDGPGIPAGRLASLREWHVGRADRGASAAAESGRGLGLGIAQRVCELQGWHLSIDADQAGAARGVVVRLLWSAVEV
jgi:signal transduction histidine kinase